MNDNFSVDEDESVILDKKPSKMNLFTVNEYALGTTMILYDQNSF